MSTLSLVELLKDPVDLSIQRVEAGEAGPWRGNEHHVPASIEPDPTVSDGLTEPALDPVTNHGVAHLAADRETETVHGRAPSGVEHQEVLRPDATTSTLDPTVILGFPDPDKLWEAPTRGFA